uniref:DUF4806 domain-containing protein n=1 Tax=Ixodes ricinus TaxID=34613 RepID=A0A6B0VBF4_IXORI
MDKPFAVIRFPDEQDCLAVVPVTWLSKKKDMSAWPLHTKGSKVSAMVEREVPPGIIGSGWEMFPCTVTSSSRTYQKALRKTKRLVNSSTVETSEVSAHEEEEEEEAHREFGVPSPPPLSSSSSSSEEQAQALPVEQPRGIQGEYEGASPAELRILRLLLEVRLQNRDTHQLLSQLDGRMARLEASGAEAAPPPPAIAATSLPRLPAMTVAELEAANEAIRDECVATALKKRLINMGGEKATEVVANIMKAIMTLPVQVQFSLYGKKGKRPFISMGLCTLALGAISDKLKIEESAAKKMVVKWLPGSCDRGGGRKRRFEASMAPEAQNAPQDPTQDPPQDPPQD